MHVNPTYAVEPFDTSQFTSVFGVAGLQETHRVGGHAPHKLAIETQLAHSALLANYGNGEEVKTNHNRNYRHETYDFHKINYSHGKKTRMGQKRGRPKESIR